MKLGLGRGRVDVYDSDALIHIGKFGSRLAVFGVLSSSSASSAFVQAARRSEASRLPNAHAVT